MNIAEQSSKQNQDSIVVRHINESDDQELRRLVSFPMTTRGLMLSFQREPSYFQAGKVIYTHIQGAVIEDKTRGKLVGCYSSGFRPCYVNGSITPLRYTGDLRLDPQVRGKSLLKYLMPNLRETLQSPNFSQIIIFDDNHAARRAIQTGRLDFDYYDEGLIETLTLTGFKHSAFPSHLQNSASDLDLKQVDRCVAEEKYIPLMNDFVKRMATRFNFVPAYDFHELEQHNAYFHGLALHDFQLYFYQDQLVGMFALWNQSSFKQSKVLDYSKKIQFFRPVYNLWAKLNGRIQLPKKGDSFKYHILHSLLCEPEQLALHERMLRDAFQLSKQRGINAITFTLSHKDPRQQLNQFYKGDLLIGMHGFITFEQDPRAQFDPTRIPFLEAGRI